MTTIMLIENIPQENKELVQVDFDDTTSWEYLFKVYWVYLKQKESFTIDELTRASNPWKGSGLEHKDQFLRRILDVNVSTVADLSSGDVRLGTNASKRRKTKKHTQLNISLQKVEKEDGKRAPCVHGPADWASKELLEFVAHMKNGDTSALSQFDVQALLLEYIRMNNLRDPRRKCQVICDRRLESLFGKARVGHFEMLKLLEYHFKERSNGMIRGAAINPHSGLADGDGITGDIQIQSREMKRQARRKGDEKGRQSNLDSYAAINVHNMNLIYLKQSLLEKLMVDAENFNDKVVGSVVRIRISSNDQRQDMHRLVRILGTSKATEPYKVRDKTQNIMLRILNLNKIEDVTIDAISDQEFSEDECRRLRQSMKLGLVERMTVGEIQEKAMALQVVRVDDWLETEILKLSHLRDRASEMGHRKELRELVAKIELLKTPEERQRRIHEIPEVRADPRMDPSYGSDDDSGESEAKKQDGSITPRYSIPKLKAKDTSKGNEAKALKTSAANGKLKRKLPVIFHLQKVESAVGPLHSSHRSERVDAASNISEELSNPADAGVGAADHGGMSPAAPDTSSTLSTGKVLISDFGELEKIWHYQDPSGKVQGPFCMLQLRKWNSSGFFPTDLRVWKISETQDQSITLNDALRRQDPVEPCVHLHDGAKSDDCGVNSVEALRGSASEPGFGNKPDEGSNSNLPTAAAASVAEGQSMCRHTNWQVTNYQNVLDQQRITNPVGSTCVNGKGNEPDEEGSNLYLPGIAVASNADKQSMSGCCTQQVTSDKKGLDESSGQNNMTNPVGGSFVTDVARPGVGTATNSPGMVHVKSKTESSDPSSPKPRSDYIDMESQAIGNVPSCLNTSATTWGMAANGTEVSDPSNSLPKSEPEESKVPNMENIHPVTSDACKDLGARLGRRSNTNEFSVVSSPPVKTGNEAAKDLDMDRKCSAANEHDSGTRIRLSCGTDVSELQNSASKADNEDVEHHAIENTHSISSNVPVIDPHSSWSSASGGNDVSPMLSPTPNLDDVKIHAGENKHYATSDVPKQDLGTSLCKLSDGVVSSDMPSATPKPDGENLKTSTAEIKHSVAGNIPGQDSGTSWGATSGIIGFTDPDTSLKLADEAFRDQALNNNHSAPPTIPGQDSCISWSTASTLVVGEVHLPDVASEWGAYSIMHPKSGGEFNSSLVSRPSSKQAEVASEQASQIIVSCALTHCSSSTPDCYTWQPIELSTLGDDSVSDLLSEVEAMESLRGMSSPTSRMDCGHDPIDSPRDHCFSLEGLNLNLDPGANDALNSTADIQFPVHPTSVNQSQGTFPFHAVGNASHEVKVEVKPAFSLMPEQNRVSNALPPDPSDQPRAAFLVDFHDLPRTTCTIASSSPKVEGEMKATDFSLPAPTSISVPPPPAAIDQPQGQFRVDVNCLPSSTFAYADPSPLVESDVKAAIVSMPPSNSISNPAPPAPIDKPQGQFRDDIDVLPSSTCVHTDPSPQVERDVEVATVLMPLLNSISEPPPPTLLPPPPLPPPILPPPPPPKPPSPPPPEPPPPTRCLDRTSSSHEKGEAGPTSALVPETISQNHQPSPKTASLKVVGAETGKSVSETSSRGREPPGQENPKLSSSGSILGNPNTQRSTRGASPGNRMSQNQTSPRYSHSAGRHSGPKDRSHHYHSVDSGFGKSRPNSWSRQSSFGGGGSSRPHSHSHSHRGQLVCKFYESGYCKKGASCKYWHP